jgi:PadR family transcriptional regulator PadR
MKTGADQSGHSFLAYFKRATSPLVVLRLLTEKPMYGYELTQAMKQRSDNAYTISVLYPVIYRLEEQGYVAIERNEVVDGRARSYYGITPTGRAYLEETWKEYLEITEIFKCLMEEGGMNNVP